MFRNLCTPAKIYFGIAVIASIFALFRGVEFSAVFMKMFFAFVWTYILGWLCKKGYSSISWFLVLLPYIIIILAMLNIAHINQRDTMFRSVGLQGPYGQEGATTMGSSMDPSMTPSMGPSMSPSIDEEKDKQMTMPKM